MRPPISLDEIRTLTDVLEVKLHLAGMEARDQWHELEPRIHELEHKLVRAGQRTKLALRELVSIAAAFHRLRVDVA